MAQRNRKPTILLVDDNAQIRSFIRPALEDNGFDCIEAIDGDEAVYHAEASQPDLIVLDIELGDPDLDGLDVCKRIRNMGLQMPVIFLTVRATADDLDRGLSLAGPGSDYVRKVEELRRMQVSGEDISNFQVTAKAPDTRELIARIKARLPQEVVVLGSDLRLDRRRRRLERRLDDSWEETLLQPLEYEVFRALIDADGAVVGTLDLFEKVFQGNPDGEDETDDFGTDTFRNRVWVCIANLRKKLSPDGQHNYIQTVHGIGYRFRARDTV